MRRSLLALTIIIALPTLLLRHAEAFPPMLREPAPPKPWFAGFTYGGAFGARHPFPDAPRWHQFKITFEGGVHFSRRNDGPALAFLCLQTGFGSDYKTLELGPRFFWDIPLVQGMGLYLSPGAMLGYAGWFPDAGSNASGISFQLMLDGKLVFAQRAFVLLRPLGLDFMGMSISGNMSLFVRYDFLLGGGMLF